MIYQTTLDSMEAYDFKTLEDLPKLKTLMEVAQIKPNISLIARKLGVDRRTAKKYYDGYTKPKTRHKTSKIDQFESIIDSLLSDDSIQVFHYKKHLWQYLVDNHQLDVAQSTFRQYIQAHERFSQYFNRQKKTPNNIAVMRFETEPGQQMQVDWKENFKFTTKEGEVLLLNVFVCVLGYSRYSLYFVTLDKRQSTLLTLLNRCFEALGGVPAEIVTDNLKTVMSESRTYYRSGTVNDTFAAFAKDYGFKVKPCIARHANTKGKVETQMKLLDELDAYQGQLTFEEVIEHVEVINRRKNLAVHQGTNDIPIHLLEIDKDSLSPLPSQEIRSLYQYHQTTVKVNASAMISYQSNQYSVPSEYIGKRLALEVEDHILYVYDNTHLVTKHPVSMGKFNYHENHYQANIQATMPYKTADDIQQMAKDNLKRIGARYDQRE